MWFVFPQLAGLGTSAMAQRYAISGRDEALAYLAHPLLGDATHGKGPLNRAVAALLGLQRLWLHAQSLGFEHPDSGESIQVDSGLCWDGQRWFVYPPNIAYSILAGQEISSELTGWAAIVAVPTAITGYYGQNVPYPGAGLHWGFVVSSALIAGISLMLYFMFKRRDWM